MAARLPNVEVGVVDVVVLGNQHNPTVLNPDFLAKNKVVPSDFVVTETITTPPMSFVRYSNGLRVTVEQSRLIVTEEIGDGKFHKSSDAVPIAVKYVQLLKHVGYSDLGFNWTFRLKKKKAAKWISARFFGNGQWQKAPRNLVQSEIKLTFEQDEVLYGFDLSPIVIDDDEYVLIKANVHLNRGGGPNLIHIHADEWSQYQDRIKEQLALLLGGKELH